MLQRITGLPFVMLAVVQAEFILLHNVEHTGLHLHLDPPFPAVVDAEDFGIVF